MNILAKLFKPQSGRDVVLHLLLILLLASIIVLFFFYVYLPNLTRHGETVEVPNLEGKHVATLEEFLEEKDLRYSIKDSTYNPDIDPLTVFLQHPEAGSEVKRGRKIYVSISTANPPYVAMPDLLGRSIINAEDELVSYGLRVGDIEYVPDLAQNAVLKQLKDGKEIAPGEQIKKGEKIDLVVGDGLGQNPIETPNLIGEFYSDTIDFILKGNNLNKGAVVYDENSEEKEGLIFRTSPAPGQPILEGGAIDIFIAGPEPQLDSTAIELNEEGLE